MRQEVIVHERVTRRHPELTEEDVRLAWKNAFVVQERREGVPNDRVLIALGADARGRMLELIAAEQPEGSILVFHAMTPPSGKMLFELGVG